MTRKPKDERITYREAAALTKLSQQQVKNLADSGKLGRQDASAGYTVIKRSALDAWVEREFGTYDALYAAVRHNERVEAERRTKVIAEEKEKTKRLDLELAERTLSRGREEHFRLLRNERRRELEAARKQGLEGMYLNAERAKFTKKKAEQAKLERDLAKAARSGYVLRSPRELELWRRSEARANRPPSVAELKRQSREALDRARAAVGLKAKTTTLPAKSKATPAPSKLTSLPLTDPRVRAIRERLRQRGGWRGHAGELR